MDNKSLEADLITEEGNSLNKENLATINKKTDNEDQNVDCIIGTSWNEIVTNFNEMNLKEELLKGIYNYGFNEPSAFQQRACLPCIKGHNIIGQASYGSTKTTTAIISILQRIDNKLNECQALILAPTRELANQISEKIVKIGNHLKIDCYTCIGGTPILKDIKELNGKQIVVGTTGRVLDMMKRGILKADHIKSFVLVNAEEMFDRDFHCKINDIHKVLIEKLDEKDLQIILLTSIMVECVLKFAKQFIKDPIHILIKNELLFEGIKQFYVFFDNEESKFETLCEILNQLSAIKQAVIFCRTRRKVEYLAGEMRNKNLNVSFLHGNVKQESRDSIIKEFKNSSTRFLITTDKLVLGIDIQQVSLVINYDLPNNSENYIHRIGGGGRFGRKGVAINFTTKKDKQILQDIEQHYKTQIEEMPTNLSDLI